MWVGVKKVIEWLFGNVEKSNADERKPIVERVYLEYDLCASTVYSCWRVNDISDDKKLVDKVIERLKASYNFKVFIYRDAVVFSCDNEQRGKIKCVFNLSYAYFTFGIVKCGERYDINKPLYEYPELKKFLENMFGEHIRDYKESRNI